LRRAPTSKGPSLAQEQGADHPGLEAFRLSSCGLCKNEAGSLGIGARNFDIGQRCYEKLIDKGAKWSSETTIEEFLLLLDA
jgi:hypothetical protein